ncbi:inner membrane protein [Klebsiella pneumoniae]|uniref:Inner membrane protein n=1 Tax=Klebsiella pneumoniae TaxID=573 RepID=A0A447S0Y6_KLEPN|nr:inner membrane protein [Klebsiella pneumoniae]
MSPTGLFVLICCWAGAQMLSMLIHAPGVFERLMQAQDASRPQVDISLAVGTLFGLIPFLIGCTFIGVLALIVRWASAPLTPRHTVCPPLINPFRKPRRRQISGDFWTLQLDPWQHLPRQGFCPPFSRRDGKTCWIEIGLLKRQAVALFQLTDGSRCRSSPAGSPGDAPPARCCPAPRCRSG